MAYNTKSIVTDKDGNPVSQYFNPTADQYEPVLGAGGGNRVLVYKADGTESSVSLLPILDKLGQLTGTVIDEEIRKSNELQRIALYNQIFNMLQAGELKGDKGDIGLTGKGLEFNWLGTQLGVRIQGDLDYVYVELKGPKGDKGETGDMENLNAQHIEDALGYVPADEDIIGMLANLTTDEKANLVAAINEVKTQSNENATDLETHEIEGIEYSVIAVRDASITGEQIIELAPDRTPKKVTFLMAVGGALQFSIGILTPAVQRCIAQIENGNMTNVTSCVYYRNSANRATGIGTIEKSRVKLNWTKEGEPTATLNLLVVAEYHGKG